MTRSTIAPVFASLDRRAALRAAAASASKKGAKPYRILNATAAEAEVRIYDEIAWYAINAEEFARELATITAPTINLRVNSPGGSVFDGLAIYNTLKAHPAKVVAHIDGLAASIASVIALAGDEVRVASGAFVMIHNPWSLVIGDAAAMRQEADVLEKVAGSLAGIYAQRTGETVDAMQALMDAETWWTAEEAVAAGYADSVAGKPVSASAAERFDLSFFAKVPAPLRHEATDEPPTIETIRDFETFLRDAGGFSRAAAASIAAGGFKAATSEPRDEDESGEGITPMADLPSAIRSLISTRAS